MSNTFTKELEKNGIVLVADLLGRETLAGMQRAFAQRLRCQRWNDIEGYEKTERHRHMIPDVLTLDQGFVDLALHPAIKGTLREYLGPHYELVEAKGWQSLPTRRDFHGWHGDAWYDQSRVTDSIPREVKVALYLTDVRSGAFAYIRGSHGQRAPRPIRAAELGDVPPDRILEATGPAGTVILFDTSGIHRQSVPILEPRYAVFLNYHDPFIPLQNEDVAYYRYHPLLLNAAFLGNLSDEDRRILGFGNKTNYVPHFQRPTEHPGYHGLIRWAYDVKLFCREWRLRVGGKLKKLIGLGRS